MSKNKIFVLFILLFSFIPFATEAVFVKGYLRKDGTYVSPHYRSSPGYGDYKYGRIPATAAIGMNKETANIPHAPIKATSASSQSINKKWLEYYKSAAMIVGDMSNLGKVEYICKFKEAEPLWESMQNSFSFCDDRGCFVRWISQSHTWQDLNKKINNVYNYLKSAEKE